MLVQVNIRSDQQRLSRILTNVKRLSNPAWLRRVGTADMGKRALRKLQSVFPRSKGRPTVNAYGRHLVTGWKVVMLKDASGLSFELLHDKAENPKVETILNALDTGISAYDYVAKNLFRFFGKYSSSVYSYRETSWGGFLKTVRQQQGKPGIVTIAEGRIVRHGARKGSRYVEKTYRFIIETLLPELRERVRRQAAMEV